MESGRKIVPVVLWRAGKSYPVASGAWYGKRPENAEQEGHIGKGCSGRGVFGELFGPVISGVPGPPGARKNAEQEPYIGKRCSGRGVFGKLFGPVKYGVPGPSILLPFWLKTETRAISCQT